MFSSLILSRLFVMRLCTWKTKPDLPEFSLFHWRNKEKQEKGKKKTGKRLCPSAET